MFFLRCTFWLAIGFVVIKPFALDANTASALAEDAFAAGKNAVIEQAMALDCNDATCVTIKSAAVVSILASKPHGLPTANRNIEEDAPIPPLRPLWAS